MNRPEQHRPFHRLDRARSRARRVALSFLVSALALPAAQAVTLPELENDARLTPRRFANYFEAFEYEYHVEVQPAEAFLASQKGDCDDYAVLADYVFRPRGAAPRLIHIRLAGGDAHAVCYVGRDKVYLDYNNRGFFINTTRCGPTIREIATKVAESLEANWTSASEYVYSYPDERKTMLATVVKTDPPENDPVPGAAAPNPLHVD